MSDIGDGIGREFSTLPRRFTGACGVGPERKAGKSSYLALRKDIKHERKWGAQTTDAYSKIARPEMTDLTAGI